MWCKAKRFSSSLSFHMASTSRSSKTQGASYTESQWRTHKCTNAQLLNAQTHKCTNAQMRKRTDAQMLNVQMHKCLLQMRKYTNAPSKCWIQMPNGLSLPCNRFVGYRVNSTVKDHDAYGIGVYTNFVNDAVQVAVRCSTNEMSKSVSFFCYVCFPFGIGIWSRIGMTLAVTLGLE